MSALKPSHQHPIDPARVARARERLPTAADASRLTSILSLLADANRARALYALDVVEELCVGDLALALETNEDAVSYALRVLRTAGMVANRKDGRVVYYRLAEGFPAPYASTASAGSSSYQRPSSSSPSTAPTATPRRRRGPAAAARPARTCPRPDPSVRPTPAALRSTCSAPIMDRRGHLFIDLAHGKVRSKDEFLAHGVPG